jgi:hypothetical protein
LVTLLLFCLMLAALLVGVSLRRRIRRSRPEDSDPDSASEGQGYAVSAILGLLALLMAFTFGIALDRYEARRHLVVTEANAIGTAYLRVQLLEEPHRTRLSNLLVAYTDNRIKLATATENIDLLATNDRLLTQIWAAVGASMDSIQKRGIANAYVQSFNDVIDLDTERKVARLTRVPNEVLLVLIAYVIVAAAVLGYVMEGVRGRITAAVMCFLLALSLFVIMDLNRPTLGFIRESQTPMIMLRKSLAAQPPAVFDQFKSSEKPRQ